MTQKVVVIGGESGKTSLMLATLKEKYGNDIIVLTPEEAQEKGIKPEEFTNLPKFEIKAPIIPFIPIKPKSGKEQRRERRKKQRLAKKDT